VIFVNERAQLLQARGDLTLLLFQEIGHRPGTLPLPINSSIPATRRPGFTIFHRVEGVTRPAALSGRSRPGP
jgi:hypothetical protein